MSAAIGTLRTEMSANAARFATDMGKARKTASSFGASLKQAYNDANKAIDKAVGSMFSFKGALLAVAGPAALGALVNRSLNAADAIAKAADATGLSTTTLQEYRYAANLAGIGAEKFDNALKAFAKNIGDARAGTGQLILNLQKIDPALAANVKSAGSTEEAFQIVLRAMDGMKSQADRASVAAAAFGRAAGVDMTVMLKDGVAGIDQLRGQAKALGLVMEESLIRDAEKAKDALEILSMVISTNLTVAVARMAPELKKFAEGALQVVNGVAELIANGRRFESVVGGTLAESIALTEGQLARLNAELDDLKTKQAAATLQSERALGAMDVGGVQYRVAAGQAKAYGKEIEALSAQQLILQNRSRDLRAQREALGAAEDKVAAKTRASNAANEAATASSAARKAAEAAHRVALVEGGKVLDSLKSKEELLYEAVGRMVALKPVLIELTGSEAAANQALDLAISGVIAKEDKAGEAAVIAAKKLTIFNQAGVQAAGMISAGFADAIVEGKSFGEVIQQLTKDIAKMVLQLLIFKAIKAGMTGGLGIAFAKGGAMSGGRLTKYASGGVTNGPVTFPMRGGMGLAGERMGRHEGIFPLTRIGGDLGVKAEIPDAGAKHFYLDFSGVDYGSQTAAQQFARMFIRAVRDNTTEGKDLSRVLDVRSGQNSRRAFT